MFQMSPRIPGVQLGLNRIRPDVSLALDSKENPTVPGALLRIKSPLDYQFITLKLQIRLEIPNRLAVTHEDPIANRPRL